MSARTPPRDHPTKQVRTYISDKTSKMATPSLSSDIDCGVAPEREWKVPKNSTIAAYLASAPMVVVIACIDTTQMIKTQPSMTTSPFEILDNDDEI